MEAENIVANAKTYSSVINACAKARDPGRAEHWLKQMQKVGFEADVICYSALVEAYGKVNDVPAAMRAFERLVATGQKPSVITYTVLAQPLAKAGNCAAVEEILSRMAGEGHAMNDYFLNLLLLSYSNAQPRQPDKAEQAFLTGVKQGVKPNRYITSSLKKALTSKAHYQEVMQKCARSGGWSASAGG